MMVRISQIDLCELMIDAVRYALPRHSYITGVVGDILRRYINLLDRHTIKQILSDFKDQEENGGNDFGWDETFPPEPPIQKVLQDRLAELNESLVNTHQISLCPDCFTMTETLMDEDGNRYCGHCYVIKKGKKEDEE